MARLTTSDKQWLARKFPTLSVVERPDFSLIEGRLHFRRSYDGVTVEDTYDIRVELFAEGKKLPQVTETAGRLERVLSDHPEFKGSLADLHMYPDKRLCLAAPPELRLMYLPRQDIHVLFDDYIVPYFYSQSYFENHGVWPWPHLPHDAYGMVTWYLENTELAGAARETTITLRKLAAGGNKKAQRIVERAMRRESFSPNSKCLCGSGKSHARCHRALMKLAFTFRFPTVPAAE